MAAERVIREVCGLDLEGIVAKRKDPLFRTTEKPSLYWIKIKNRQYSQAEGREEFIRSSAEDPPLSWIGVWATLTA